MFEPEKTANEQSTILACPKLAGAKYVCTSVPYNDSLREDHPPTVKKVLHNVPCPKDAPSKYLPTVTVTFHQKKTAPSNDEFEVESTLAQLDVSTDEECLSPFEGEEDSILSDMGTNGSVDCCQ